MSYEITLRIQEGSEQERNIETLAEAEHVSREEAALRLIAQAPEKRAAGPEARSILGAAREDAALMDEVLELVMSDRQRHNAEPPHA